jgi:glycosyltransferase involved in cell wall biosynthesis
MKPSISVVIPTKDRPDKVPQAVASVLANDHRSFDLTVIDQSRTTATEVRLRDMAANDPRLHYVHVEETGLSRARNAGIRKSTGSILAFTDDDCVVPANWLTDIESVFESEPDGALMYGPVRPFHPGDPLTPFLDLKKTERLSRADGFRIVGMGANFAVRRRLFDAIGAFDVNLGAGGPLCAGEDFDFAYRTYLSGSVILLRPEVSVLHDGHRDLVEWPRLIRNYGIGDGAFYSKHVRCGDLRATRMLSGRIATMAARVAAKRVLRRPGNENIYLRGLLSGIRQGLSFSIDRGARNYVPQ